MSVWRRWGVLWVIAAMGRGVWGQTTQGGMGLTDADRAALKWVVGHPSDEEGWKVVGAIKARRAAVAVLTEAFRDPAEAKAPSNRFGGGGGRAALVESMAQTFRDDAADVLVEAVKDTDQGVRLEAAADLGYCIDHPTEATRKAEREALSDVDETVVEYALTGLWRSPDEGAAGDILKIVRQPPSGNGDVYLSALDALGKVHDVEAVEDMVALAGNREAAIREKAARAIGSCSRDAEDAVKGEAMEALRNLVRDPNEQVALAAGVGLAEKGDGAGIKVICYELRRVVGIPPKQWDRLQDLYPLVRGLEVLTKEDFGAEADNDRWTIYMLDKDFPAKVAAAGAAVNEIMERLKARGIETEGYPEMPRELTGEEKEMLERGLKNWITDPRGGQWISFTRDVRTVWGQTSPQETEGWMFGKGTWAYVLLEDGERLAVPKERKAVDFLGETRERVAFLRSGKDRYPMAHEEEFTREVHAKAVIPDAVRAAWLYRLGHEDLAAEELFMERGGERMDWDLDEGDADGAWRTFAEAVNARVAGRDEEALVAAERLEKVYGQYLDEFGNGTALLADLRRRKAEGTLGAGAATQPVDFEKWPVEKEVAWAVKDLENVDTRQMGQPAGVDLTRDLRVKRLVALGDAAVPALIDCIESDERLTRSVEFWRNFARQRTVIGVREAALTAVMTILQTRAFSPVSTGDTFTGRGEDAAKETALELRAYWEKYKKDPLDGRMMKVLTDEKAKLDAALEAAWNLALNGQKREIGTMEFTGGVEAQPAVRNPLIEKYSHPTIAEAMLAARDRALAAIGDDAIRAAAFRGAYAAAIAALGDDRIVQEVKRRFDASKELKERREWAEVAHALRDEGPEEELAREAAAVKSSVPGDVHETRGRGWWRDLLAKANR